MKGPATGEPSLQTESNLRDAVIHFSEGLIGCVEQREFVLSESESILPFRLLQDAQTQQPGFVVLDPRFRVQDYFNKIPLREWQAVGVDDPAKGLALVIVNIGENPKEATA